MLGVDYYTHERNSSLGMVQLFKNSLPHDPRPYAAMVEEFWEQHHTDQEVVSQGTDFFEERPKKILTGWTSMVKDQVRGLLPEEWEQQRRNIVIFGSTEGEFVALQDLYEGAPFQAQIDAYSSLLHEASKECPELMFYLRLHPNSKNELNQWWTMEAITRFSNLRIVKPEDPVSSYALLQSCEKVLGIGSSMCLEATYWGKPSILLGLTFYSGLDAVYESRNVVEACQLLKAVDLPAKNKINAIKFGAFMRGNGERLPHSIPVNYYTMTFKGEILEANRDVLEWLSECEKRPPVRGWKKWLQNRKDNTKFSQLLSISQL
jgi:hypothetical protein